MADDPQAPTNGDAPVGDPMASEPIGVGATIWIEIIREIARNILGLGSTGFILYMLYQFVMTSPQKENVMFLVIGNVMGFLMGIGTWYFGGSMRSALAALRQNQTTKG